MTRPEQLFLQPGGSLDPAAPSGSTAAEPLTAAGVVFERTVSDATAVSGSASALVHVRLLRTAGGGSRTGQVELVLESCPAAGACTVLASGSEQVQQAAAETGFAAVPVDLAGAAGAVPPGGVLRLTVLLGRQGNADGALLGFGSTEVPGSLTVTTTSTAAPTSDAAGVVGVGLLTSVAAGAWRRRQEGSAHVG